jgi:hypothetical protein
MTGRSRPASRRLGALALVAASLSLLAACGDDDSPAAAAAQGGAPITRTEGAPISGAEGWQWIPFPDSTCTDAIADATTGRYRFGTSTTGLAISWGPESSTDLVVFLQGGGACWDWVTCGGAAPLVDKTALAGPFGPNEFAREIHAKYPESWIRREKLPPSLRDATIVFVPYCTGDVHGGDKVTTYSPPVPGGDSVTWHHAGRPNVLAFLKRLAPTFPRPRKLVVAGASAGGFGTLANYTEFRARWPDARAYLVDDSAPPLEGNAIPSSSRAAWYASWNLGASLDPFCPGCRQDLSQGLRELLRRYPSDRIALISHLQDAVIRGFYGNVALSPTPVFGLMPAAQFEAELRRLGTTVLDASPNGRYFFTEGDGHPTLEDPGRVTTPAPGLPAWLELMLSDAPAWASASDP